MVRTYDDLYHEVVRRAEKERSAVASIDPKVIAERVLRSEDRDAAAERVNTIRKVVEDAFDAASAR